MASSSDGPPGDASISHFPYMVIGGGIAGVSCAEMLSQLCPTENILLLSSSPLVKAVTNFRKVSKMLEEFDVEEKPMSELSAQCPNVRIVQDAISKLCSANKQVVTKSGIVYTYNKLCVCTGGSPKVIFQDNPYVLGIRDTESVQVFQKKLTDARRVVVVGNGGIATELAYQIEGCEVIWAIKDESITSTFVDAGAAKFFLPMLCKDKQEPPAVLKRTKYKTDETVPPGKSSRTVGSALGPDWHDGLEMHGAKQESHNVHVEYKVEVARLLTAEQLKAESLAADEFPDSLTHSDSELWPVYVELTNKKIYGCDFVVSATGVVPNTGCFLADNKFEVAEDGGLVVSENMLTSVSDVYGAGDVCTVRWQHSEFWHQMRLWPQARQMGAFAAQCMVAHTRGEDIQLDFCFELFAHVTKFFNYKVVLLGNFNALGLGSDYELYLRVTKGVEYVKTVMRNGRMHGAILIGDTDLEETFENLILNQIDLSHLGEDILDPGIDIEDYFD